MGSYAHVITPSKVFSGFAVGKNSVYEVAFVKYQNYEIKSTVTVFVGHGLEDLHDKKLQNSCVFENFDVFGWSN